MFKEPDTLIGLGVGTTKIAVIVAERDPRSRETIQIIGIGSTPSLGIRKGLIVNLEQAVRSVRTAVKDAENMVGYALNQAVVSFNAGDVSSVMSSGMVALGLRARPVEVEDVERVIEAAQTELSIPANKIALHTIPVRYSIDGNFGIEDPLGMTGMRLEMELQTITVPTPYVQNIVNCVEASGIKVDGLVIKPITSALGALTEEEMRIGAVSLCIGGGTTGLTFYRDGRPVKVAIVPIGGDHITNDLASVLRLPLNKAEELKKRLFVAENDDPIKLDSKGQQQRTIDPNVALEIIACRLEELFTEHVAPLIPEHDPKLFPGGFILSGGVAKTPGIEDLLSDIFKIPVRVADPRDSYHQMPPGRDDTSYINAIGTIRYMLSKERNPYRFIDPPVSLWRGGSGAHGSRRDNRDKNERSKQRSGQGMKNFLEKIKESLKELF
ncbi:MAG: cell division protein FtsA [Synergistaceae bacterium]|nr:cell division protein FtsA [Synergistaceae bacterium]